MKKNENNPVDYTIITICVQKVIDMPKLYSTGLMNMKGSGKNYENYCR